MTEILDYVNERLESGESVVSIAAELKKSGWSESEIDSVLKKALAAQSSAGKNHDDKTETDTTKAEPKHFSATTAFTVIGVVLICAALIIVISSTWVDVSPLTRILYLALPMLALYGISYYLKNKNELPAVQAMTELTGAAMFPFVVGTFLYQTKLISEINSSLFAISATVSLVFYLIFEFILRKNDYAALSALATYVLAISLLAKFEAGDIATSWTFVAISLAWTLAGYLLLKARPKDGRVFFKAGLAIASLALPAATLISLNHNTALSDTANSLTVVGFGLIYLALAPLIYEQYQTKSETVFYSCKRFLEELAVIMILVPFLTLGDTIRPYIFIALILSIAYILVNIRIKIKMLLLLGILGLISSVLTLTSRYFADSSSWPVAVFIAGFLAIGLGIFAKKISDTEHKIEPYHGLGQDDKAENKDKRGSVVNIILWILGLFVAINILGFIISYSVDRNSSRYNSAPMTVTEYPSD